MSKPATVTVTGAAGQIGYALLFRIGVGGDAGTGHTGPAAVAGNPARTQGRRRYCDGTPRLRIPPAPTGIDITDGPEQAFDGSSVGCWSAPAPADPEWNGRTCCGPTA